MKSLKLLVFTLSVAMLMAVSACSEPPPPTPVYTPNFTENEVIAIARESKLSSDYGSGLRLCWKPDAPYITNGTTSATASLKKNGLWVVTATGSWKTKDNTVREDICTFLVDDATGKVREP